MVFVAHEERLMLDVRGQRMELLIPPIAQGFRSMHLADAGFEYEGLLAALLDRIVRGLDSPKFLDIGAFIGYYSVLGGKLIGNRGRVWAIESHPEYASVLRRVIALNGLTNVDVVPTALSDHAETMRSTDKLVPVPAASSRIGVVMEAETADAMCERLGIAPNVAKMDVHGFEGKILGGMQRVLHGSLRYLLLELHPEYYLQQVTPVVTRIQILDWLNAAGFITYLLAGTRFWTGRFSYERLTPANRDLLLFDADRHVFVLATKAPIDHLLEGVPVDGRQFVLDPHRKNGAREDGRHPTA